MGKYIDTKILLSLIEETVKMYEDVIDSCSDEEKNHHLEVYRNNNPDNPTNFLSVEQIMAGHALFDLSDKIRESIYFLLSNNTVVRSVYREGMDIIVEERPLNDAEITKNVEMGINDIERFIADSIEKDM